MSKLSREDREFTRRAMLIRTAAATLAATGLETPGVVFAQNQAAQTPGVTEGPYWLDNTPARGDVRTNTATGAVQAGFKLLLSINVSRLANNVVTPVQNAKVDIWHCGALDLYSGFSTQSNQGQAGLNYLRGNLPTTARGAGNFTTIFPGWYRGRTPHIHFRVRTYNGATVTFNFVSQLFSTPAIMAQVYATAPYSQRPNPDTPFPESSVMHPRLVHTPRPELHALEARIAPAVLSDNLSAATNAEEVATVDRWIASSFATGASAYSLTSATLLLSNPTAGAATVSVYTDDANAPGTLVATLTSPATYSA